jgi:CRP-like cAMP-binding protein
MSGAHPDGLRGNRLLAALPEAHLTRLARDLEPVSLEIRDMVYEQGETIEHVHFPVEGVISLVAGMQGRDVEIATVGNEGMLGLPVFLQAAKTSSHRAFCQIAARSYRLDADVFNDALGSNGHLHRVLHLYTQALLTQVGQNAACNAVHDVEQRAARWIAMTHDRVSGDDFVLTREFLAQMLAVGRPAVNAAAQTLQDKGRISYSRERLTVLDRSGLESDACECYQLIRSELDRLVPPA